MLSKGDKMKSTLGKISGIMILLVIMIFLIVSFKQVGVVRAENENQTNSTVFNTFVFETIKILENVEGRISEAGPRIFNVIVHERLVISDFINREAPKNAQVNATQNITENITKEIITNGTTIVAYAYPNPAPQYQNVTLHCDYRNASDETVIEKANVVFNIDGVNYTASLAEDWIFICNATDVGKKTIYCYAFAEGFESNSVSFELTTKAIGKQEELKEVKGRNVIGEFYPSNENEIVIEKQSYTDAYINWHFKEINRTHWLVSFNVDPQFLATIKGMKSFEDIDNLCGKYLQEYCRSNDKKVKIFKDLQNIKKYPLLNLTKNIAVDRNELDISLGSGSFYLIFPQGFKAGESAKFGFDSTVINTTQATNQVGYLPSNRVICKDGAGILHVAWRYNDTLVAYANSSDGVTWNANITFIDGSIFYTRFWPHISCDGNNITVAYNDDSLDDLMVAISTNNGATWTWKNPITSSVGYYVAIERRGQRIYIVYTNSTTGSTGAIMFINSSDGGNTWGSIAGLNTPTVIMLPGVSPYYMIYPSMAVNGSGSSTDKIYVVAKSDFNNYIYFVNSTNAGTSWGAYIGIMTDHTFDYPSITFSGSNLFVTSNYHASSNYDIYFTNSTNEGISWTSDYTLETAGTTMYPSVTTNSINPWVFWQDNNVNANSDIAYVRYNGTAWKSKVFVTNNNLGNGLVNTPYKYYNDGKIHFIWENGTGLTRQLMYDYVDIAHINNCSVLDIPNTVYYLTADISTAVWIGIGQACMNITANNVTLDCQGYMIDGVDTGGTWGIYASRSSPTTTNITIKNCTVRDWSTGIEIVNANYNTLTNLTVISNWADSIYLTNVNNSIINNSVVTDNNDGIQLNAISCNNIIANSTISSSANKGISIYNINNTVYNNRIENNGYGIRIFDVNNSKVYNNLFNQTNNVESTLGWTKNYWNTTNQTGTRIYYRGTNIGGNYWTNPAKNGYSDTCTDANADGFCDKNYTLETDNIDYLPLSNNWSDKTLPTYSKNTANTTEAGMPCNFSLEWNDGYWLNNAGQYKFSTNNSGTWQNASWINFTATPQNATNVTTLNSTLGTVVAWCFYATDNTSNANNTNCEGGKQFTLTTTDTTPPKYSLPSTNTTQPRAPVKFSLRWTDNSNLSGYVFSFNNGTTSTPLLLSNSTFKAYYGNGTSANPDLIAKTEFNDIDYNSTNVSDNNRKVTSGTGTFVFEIQKFEYNLSKLPNFDVDTVSSLKYCYEGYYTNNTTSILNFGTLRHYNVTSGSWDTDYNLTYGSDATNCTEFTSNFRGLINSTNFFKFAAIAGDFGDGANATIYTDYVNLTATYAPMYNDSWNNTGWDSADEWSNVTKIINSTHTRIYWKVYANDTSNNWNYSTAYNFTTSLGTTNTTPFYPNQRAICRDGKGYVHIVWRSSDSTISYVKSTDNGVSFSANDTIVNSTGSKGTPSISCDGNNITIAYQNSTSLTYYNLIVAISTDNGATFNIQMPRNSNVNSGVAVERRGQRIYVVYQDNDFMNIGGYSYDAFDINFFNSTDGGNSWGTDKVIFNGNSDGCDIECQHYYYPTLAVNGTGSANDEIFVAAKNRDDLSITTDIRFDKSTNSGSSWNGNNFVQEYNTYISGEYNYPSITFNASNSSQIYVSYYKSSTNELIRYANSTDKGATWKNTSINTTNNKKSYPSVTINNVNAPIVFWQENYTNYNIVYRNNTGSAWGSLTNLTQDINAQYPNTKWNYAGNCIELVYIIGTSSPYNIVYNYIGTCNMPPTLSYDWTSPDSGSAYSSGTNYNFNVTVCDLNGIADNSTVNFEWNGQSNTTLNTMDSSQCWAWTDTCFNCTATKTDLAANTYTYKWYENDSANQWATLTGNYVVNKGILNLTISGSDVNYPNLMNATTTENNNGDADVNYTLYRNTSSTIVNFSSTLGNGNISQNILLGVGSYLYTFNTTAGPFANYTANTTGVNLILSVDKGTLSNYLDVLINGLKSDNQTNYTTPTTMAGTFNSTGASDITFKLFRNDSDVISENNTAVTLGAGTYQYKYGTIQASATNWTVGNSSIRTLTVNPIDPSSNLSIFINGSAVNTTITYPSIANVSANETVTADTDCVYTLWRNDTQLINGNSVWNATLLGNATYAFKYNTSGCTNWTSGSSQTLYLYVNKGNRAPTIQQMKIKTEILGGSEVYTLIANYSGCGDDCQNYTTNDTNDWYFDGLGTQTSFDNNSLVLDLGTPSFPLIKNLTINDTGNNKTTYNVTLDLQKSWYYQNETGTTNRTYQLIARNATWTNNAPTSYPINITWNFSSPSGSISNVTVQSGAFMLFNNTYTILSNSTWKAYNITSQTPSPDSSAGGSNIEFSDIDYNSTNVSDNNRKVTSYLWYNSYANHKFEYNFFNLPNFNRNTVTYMKYCYVGYYNITNFESGYGKLRYYNYSSGGWSLNVIGEDISPNSDSTVCKEFTSGFLDIINSTNFFKFAAQAFGINSTGYANATIVTNFVNLTIVYGSTLNQKVVWYGDWINETNESWRQDTIRTTTANSTAFVTHSIWLNNSWNFTINNLYIEDYLPNRTDIASWSCTKISYVNVPNSTNTSFNQPINCSANNIIQPLNTSNWVQDNSSTTTAGGFAYVKGKSYFNNTDSISYSNVSVNSTSYYNNTLNRSIDWNCSWNSSYQTNLSFSVYSVNQTADYSVLCNKNNTITKTDQPWYADNSTEQNLTKQWIIKKVNGNNTDQNVAYVNVNYTISEFPNCKANYSCNVTSENITVNANTAWSRWINATNSTVVINTTWTNRYAAPDYYQNITINDTDDIIFYNLTAWTLNFNDTNITAGTDYIKYWNGTWVDITPSSNDTNCNTSSPNYTAILTSNGTFYVCKKDTNGNGKIDYFKFKIPYISNTTAQILQVGGKDTTPPNYSVSANINYSYPKPGEYLKLYSRWQDDIALSWYKFEWNASGTPANETNGTLSGIDDWANVTLLIPTNRKAGDLIAYKFYVNDSSNSWNSTNNTFIVWGWSNVTEISVSNLYGNNRLNRSITPVTCRVMDANNSQSIQNYPVNFYVNNTTWSISSTNYTNQTGYAIWYYNSYPNLGSYTIKCNITDNDTLYYNDSINQQSIDIEVWRILNLNLTVSPTEIYRNDTFSPFTSTFQANLTDENGGVSEVSIDFKVSGSSIGQSPTGSDGIATKVYNPSNTSTPGNKSVFSTNYSAISYSYPSSDTKYIIIKGLLYPTIDSPNASYYIFHKNETIDLLSTITDENGNGYTALNPTTFNWTLGNDNIYYGTSDDTTWQVPLSHSSGQFNLNLTANKTWYDTGWKNYTIEVWDYFITVNTPQNLTIWHRTENVNLNASLKDEKNNNITDYSQFNWILNGTNIANDNVTSWNVLTNQNLGLSELNSTARVDYASGFYYVTNTTLIYVYGWSNVTDFSPTGTFPQGTLINVTCRVRDANTSENITNYTVNFYNDGVLNATNLTNSSGIAVWHWDTAIDSATSHNIKCNITDNSSLNYNYSYPNEQNGTIGLSASLYIDQVIKQHDEIYRNSSCTGCSPYSTLITVHVMEAALGNSSGANVSFFNSTNYLDSCLTNSSGYCNITFNPPDDTTPQNYTIYLNATKPPLFNPSPTSQTWVTVKGKLLVYITSPGGGDNFHKTQNASLTASVTDENGNQLSATVNWYNETSQLLNNDGSSVTGANTFWVIPSDYPLGDSKLINATASKQYFDSASDSIEAYIYGRSNVTLLSPVDGSYIRGTIINILCRVTDANSSVGIGDYQINFWNDSTPAYYNNSNQTGYGNYSWNTSNIPVGQHKLNCTIASNSALYYDVSIGNSYTTVNITGNLTTQLISVSQSSIYRNDSWAQLNGKNYLSNITIRVIDEYLNPVSNSNVSFYQNESYIGYCYPTNSSGYCTYTYNASDTLTPSNYSIKFNSTKLYYNYSTTNETYIAVLGKLYPNITYAPQKSYRNDNVQLNSTTKDENGNIVTPSYVIWYLNQTNISSLDNTQQNITWSIPINQQTGQFFLNASVNKTWYDSNYNVTQTQIWTKANITLYLPSSTTFDRGNSITYYANVTDYYNNSPVSNYNCSWWLDNSTINSSLTNTQGTCNWTWQTNCNNITRDYAGLHIINSSIGSNSSVFYDPNINNSYKNTTLQGFLKIRIDSPQNNSVWHKTDSLWLNSTTNSECSSETITGQSVNWTLNNTQNINTGINYLWTILSNQTPGSYFINSTVNKTFYYSIYNTSNIQIWGWSNASWIYPNGSQPYGNILNLTCSVTDANNSTIISGYNVSFWRYNTSSGSFDFVNSNITFNGNATYSWNTAPEQLGLFMWKCNITDNSTLYYNASSKESFANITLTDLTPPTIENLSIIPNSSFETNYNYTNITIDATDNFVVNNTWATITLPNTTKTNVTLNHMSGNTYRGNYTPVIGGLHNVTIYANDTSNNIASISSNFTAIGNTTGILLQVPYAVSGPAITAFDINRSYNFTFIINVTLNNTGNGTMRLVSIFNSTALSGGFYSNSSTQQCSNISPGENCTKGFEINVTSAADASSPVINMKSNWQNPDYSTGTATNYTNVKVLTNSVLYINKNSINGTVNQSTTVVVDNFTLSRWGNADLYVINVSKVDGNLSEEWVSFYGKGNINDLPPWNIMKTAPDKIIDVNVSISNGQDPGIYWANFTVNATGSFIPGWGNCTPPDKCWKFFILNITVPENDSWNITPNETNITVPTGLVVNFNKTVNNIGNTNKTWLIEQVDWPVCPGSHPTVICPDSIFVEKISSSNVSCSAIGGTGGNYTLRLRFSNSSASPTELYTYVNMEVLDPPPQINNPNVSPSTVDENYGYATISANVFDNDISKIDMVWINVTRPDSAIEIINFSVGGSSSYSLSYNYTPTQTGNYSVRIYANDTPAGGTNYSQLLNFTAVGDTSINIQSNTTAITIYNITQNVGNSFGLNISINNTGPSGAYFVNQSFELPSGWTASSSFNYNNLTLGTYRSNTSTITIPKATQPGTYLINATVNWTNPSTSTTINRATITVTVASNPIINIVQDSLSMIVKHGSSNSTYFTLNSTGNTPVLNISINNISCVPESCTNLSISFNESSISSLGVLNTRNINVSVFAPLGFSPGDYIITINASGTGTSDAVNLTITVPSNASWSRDLDSLSQLSVGLNTTGDIGLINITNYGNIPITFNISTSGNGTSYVSTNATSITINKQSSDYIKVNYSSPDSIPTSSEIRAINVSVYNSTADPNYPLNTTASIKIYRFMIVAISPTQTNPVNIYTGNITEIHANASIGDSVIGNLGSGESIAWAVKFNTTDCPLNSTPVFNQAGGYWVINCTAPILTDALNYTLIVISNYSNSTGGIANVTSAYSEPNAVYYIDITPPNITVYADSVPLVVGGSNASIRANVTDNLAVSKAIAEITFPNSTEANYTMTNISTNRTWEYNLTNLDYGDYDVKVYANDTTNNWNSNTSWFEVYYSNLAWFNGTTLDKDSNPVTINFTLYRPSTTSKLYNFSSNTSGNYSQQIKIRHYDFIILTFNNTINLTNVSITGNVGNNTAAPISLDNIPVSLIGGGTRISKAMYVQTILNYTNAILVLNYSGTSYIGENNLGVYRCSGWAFTNRSCSSGWSRINSTLDNTLDTLTVGTTDLSGAYVAAEFICGDGICETTYGESNAVCPTDCPSPTVVPTGPSGGGGGGGGGGGAVTPPEVTTPITLTTTLLEITLHPGEYQTTSIGITNNQKEDTTVSLSVEGDIWPFTMFDKDKIDIKSKDTAYAKIKFFTMPTTIPGVYNGNIIVKSKDTEQKISVILRVEYEREKMLDIKVEPITKEIMAGDTFKYQVTLYNLGLTKRVDVYINYTIKSVDTDKIIAVSHETMAVETSLSFMRSIDIPEGTEAGLYSIEADAWYENHTATSIASFSIVKAPWIITFLIVIFTNWITYLILFILIPSIYFGYRYYEKWRMEKIARARYIRPVDLKKLPNKGLLIGKVAETNTDAYFDENKLTTHMIVAGGTGSGKSVAAMVMAEECLKKGIPVIVFDPTAQWTGFVRRCTDKDMLKLYPKFGMKEEESRSFKGTIIDITDPFLKVEVEKYIKEGEITVFVLNRLTADQLDYFVRKTIDYMFSIQWPESRKLKLLVVYDEVHRLLPKYAKEIGATLEGGGYLAVERACREFRKWGIGLIMISQVLLDFKGAIRAVIATESQMRTKYEGDINRIKTKYGWEYATTIPKLEVGTGMIQNPEYNDGKPWFIRFRPLLHDTFRLSEEELDTYEKYIKEITEIEEKIEKLKNKGIDTYDMELELKLATDKVKTAQMRMAETYIDSIKTRMKTIEEGQK